MLETFALILLILTLPGTLYLAVLTVAGILPARRPPEEPFQGRLAIVVPAHDEAAGIKRTLDNLLPAARKDGACEVIVVADNCGDTTAAVAETCGARVVERHDPIRRGKGYALDFAFRALLREDFAAFIVVDADSQADGGLIGLLRGGFGGGAQVLQVRYTVLNGNDSPRTRLAEIALSAFNVLRPRGRSRLGLSAGILGNGFALRREALEKAPYTATSVVEDLEYHLRLIEAGLCVEFIDRAGVRGEMPAGRKGRDIQCARWEGGRLRMLKEQGPRLATQIIRGRWRLLDPLADLLLPPLGYHVMALLASLAILLISSPPWQWALALVSLAVVALHVIAAIHVAGLPWSYLRVLARIPAYLLWKAGMLKTILSSGRRDSPWVRTDRNGS